MAPPTAQVQILDKSDYSKQVLLSVPTPSSPLDAGRIRIQSRILSVTSNTFMYARLGHILGWWDVWPPVPSLPAPYSDTAKYGRISSWGYAEVIESTHDQVPVGTTFYGYLPIGDYPETLQVDVDAETGHILETSERRKWLMTLYNRYIPTSAGSADKESRGLDSVVRVLFETSFLLNRYAFSWEGKQSHPMGIPAPGPWSEQDADLTDSVVLLLGSSSKTGLAFAHQLRHGRPAEHQPRKIVAIGSATSANFSKNTGLFDDVVLYSDSGSLDIVENLGIDTETKVLLVNFGARGEADLEWYTALKGRSDRFVTLIIGSDPKEYQRPKLAALAEDPKNRVFRGNASTLRDFAMAAEGAAKYFEILEQKWKEFRGQGAVLGLKLEWGRGMEELKDGWNDLCAGKKDPTVGLVYEL